MLNTQDLLFLDTETTGNAAASDRLVAVAYKIDGKMTHQLFKPPVDIAIDAQATHHITPEMVADKPAFAGSQTQAELETLLATKILVAHNAAFDIGILQNEGLNVPSFICSLKVARHLDGAGVVPRFGLQYLRYYLKLNVASATAHSADGDVLVTEALFNRLLEKIRQEYDNDDEAITAMIDISLKPSLIKKFSFGKYRGQSLTDVVRTDPGYLEWLLRAKEQPQDKTQARSDDEDMIFSLKHYLAHRKQA